jgi:hypothetical protein
MGRILLLATLAACSPRAVATGPSWPKARTVASDGGESLAPHVARREVTKIEQSEDNAKPAPVAPAAKPAAAVAPAAESVPVPTIAPAAQPMEETITTEDIVIEIDD